MNAPMSIPPTSGEARLLVERLRTRSRVAASDFAIAYLDRIAQRLTDRSPRLDPHLCNMAAADAIMSLVKNPFTYDPAQKELEDFLIMVAGRKLKTLLRSEGRHHRGRVRLEVVEVSPQLREHVRDERDDPARVVERREALRESAARWQALPDGVRHGLTPQELRALELLHEGAKGRTPYAEVLEIMHLPLPERNDTVDRVKDKLKHRLKRAQQHRDRQR